VIDEGEGTLRVTAVGASLSGKGRLLWNRWVSKRPRVTIIDHTGEWARNGIAADYASGLGNYLDVLHRNVGRDRWRIVANLNFQEVGELAGILVPDPDAWARSPIVPLGGMALYLPEVDLSIDPNPYDRSRTLWRRGRHVLLDVFADTQSPASTSKEVFKCSEIVPVFNVVTSSDVRFIERLAGSPEQFQRALGWIRNRYHAAVFLPQRGKLILLPPGSPNLAP